jgi:uncharacterized protein YggE
VSHHDHIRVTGTARRALQPDSVTWRVEATELDDDARAAFERCAERMNRLSEQLAAVGDVTTSAVAVQPDWDDDGSGRHSTRKRAVGAVRVQAAIARAGDAAQAAMAAGADSLDGPRFVYDAAQETRAALLDAALADARAKAERLATAAGRKLGRVRTIDAGDDDHRAYELSAFASGGGPEVIPRDQDVTASVTVEFALD